MIRYLRLGLLLIGLLTTPWSWGDEIIVGYVKTLTPNAVLIHNNRSEQLKIGSPVYSGSIIKTDSKGSAGLVLKDDTVLSLGADSEFEISDFVYKPSNDQLKLNMKILKGTLEYISGVISKLKPEAISLMTPTGIIGVRGTRFVVKVDD